VGVSKTLKKRNKRIKLGDSFRFLIIASILTMLYIDIYYPGKIGAYVSIFVLTILWASVLYYISTTYKIGKAIYRKIFLSIIVGIFFLLITFVINSVFGRDWAIGVFGLLYALLGLWIYENIIKKKK